MPAPTCPLPSCPNYRQPLAEDGKGGWFCRRPHSRTDGGKAIWYRVEAPKTAPQAAQVAPGSTSGPAPDSGVLFALEAAARVLQGSAASPQAVIGLATDLYFGFVQPGLAGQLSPFDTREQDAR
jgi:hypothetical protein